MIGRMRCVTGSGRSSITRTAMGSDDDWCIYHISNSGCCGLDVEGVSYWALRLLQR